LIQNLKYEADIHRQLRHPNIVFMLGVVFEESNYGIILEFVTYGSWIDFINNIKDEESSKFFSSLCQFRQELDNILFMSNYGT